MNDYLVKETVMKGKEKRTFDPWMDPPVRNPTQIVRERVAVEVYWQ